MFTHKPFNTLTVQSDLHYFVALSSKITCRNVRSYWERPFMQVCWSNLQYTIIAYAAHHFHVRFFPYTFLILNNLNQAISFYSQSLQSVLFACVYLWCWNIYSRLSGATSSVLSLISAYTFSWCCWDVLYIQSTMRGRWSNFPNLIYFDLFMQLKHLFSCHKVQFTQMSLK